MGSQIIKGILVGAAIWIVPGVMGLVGLIGIFAGNEISILMLASLKYLLIGTVVLLSIASLIFLYKKMYVAALSVWIIFAFTNIYPIFSPPPEPIHRSANQS